MGRPGAPSVAAARRAVGTLAAAVALAALAACAGRDVARTGAPAVPGAPATSAPAIGTPATGTPATGALPAPRTYVGMRAVPAFATGVEQADWLARPGDAEVRVLDRDWRDDARGRALPVRMRVPQPCTAAERRPLVLFSHGLGGSRAGGAAWGEHWASHGFVVIHLQHPGSDESLWRGRPGGFNRTNLREGMDGAQYLARTADVRFVLDRLAVPAAADPALACVDASRAGMSGHSFGALTTQAVAGQALPRPDAPLAGAPAPWLREPRVVAAVGFSPSMRADGPAARASLESIVIPFFVVTGSRDGDVMSTGATPARRRAVYDAVGSTQRFLLWFGGADHFAFDGSLARAPAAGVADDAHVRRATRAATLAFWQATLLGDAAALQWLAGGGPQSLLDGADAWAARTTP